VRPRVRVATGVLLDFQLSNGGANRFLEILRGSRHVTVDGEVCQEGRYLGRPYLQRMTLFVKQDESPNPPDVGVLRAQRQMADVHFVLGELP
jgi:hypothetical protein